MQRALQLYDETRIDHFRCDKRVCVTTTQHAPLQLLLVLQPHTVVVCVAHYQNSHTAHTQPVS